MTTNCRARLIRDLQYIDNEKEKDEEIGFSCKPLDDNILEWDGIIYGPLNTMWEGGSFRISMIFENDYPNKPPKVQFQTQVFHPNVYNDGKICLDLLQKSWVASYNVLSVLTSIRSLLNDPNPNSPANPEAAKMFTDDVQQYNQRVNQCVENSWKYTFV